MTPTHVIAGGVVFLLTVWFIMDALPWIEERFLEWQVRRLVKKTTKLLKDIAKEMREKNEKQKND